ncbi:mannitol-1-phosphate 5-dehydrogenase [Paenibacillus sp. PL2-23]|uniref:mannitol-1-phosphate 5-dehydrogenase n=1 Tax=Paenibacillus sp. PL2-23 TaxID=2100729 RepID=UPI0030F8D10E
MKAVHIGPGNIGRGFIGALLSDSGFEVIFVARNERKVQLLQQKKRYEVKFANEANATNEVNNISAISSKNKQGVAQAIADADLVTTAVGVNALPHIAGLIAEGISMKLAEGITKPLHVMACENAVGGSSQLKARVMSALREEDREKAEQFVAFPNTAVDRIIPGQEDEDSLSVTVEPYYEWVIDRSEMLEGFPPIKGVKYVDHLAPYIERKLFTVNTGHCVAAYHGYLAGYETIQEAMKDDRLRSQVVNVLRETGAMLTTKYHWDEAKHRLYIQKMITRFSNPRLTDEIVRVGRSPMRKLSLNDRLIRPALQAHSMGLPVQHLTSAIAAAMLFDYELDPEAVALQRKLSSKGVDEVITQIMGIPRKHKMHPMIASKYHEMKARLNDFSAQAAL